MNILLLVPSQDVYYLNYRDIDIVPRIGDTIGWLEDMAPVVTEVVLSPSQNNIREYIFRYNSGNSNSNTFGLKEQRLIMGLEKLSAIVIAE